MTRVERLVFSAAFATSLLLAPSRALAADAVKFGVGVIGAVGGNFLDKPDRGALDPDVYPGFAGATLGAGLLLDLRLVDIFAVEADIIRSSDHGSGTVTLNGVDFDVTIGQGAWHIPVLAKLTLGTSLITPIFFAGPEFVLVSDPETEVDGPSGIIVPSDVVTAQASNYTMITFGGGIEIRLPLPLIDIRVPLTLRASYNPSVPSDFGDRVAFPSAMSVRFDSEWKYAVLFTAGAAVYF